MTNPTSPLTPESPLLDTLDRNRKAVLIGLLALAAVLLAAGAGVLVKYHWEHAAEGVWAILLALIAGAGGVWLLTGQGEAARGRDAMRLLVLMVGGLSGFTTFALSLALTWRWSDVLFGGVDAWQGENGHRIWLVALAMLAGLGLMFVSLMPARSVERSDPGMRRLLYGYNAFQTGLLLVAILLLTNGMVFSYFTTYHDWTEKGIYSLDERTKNILKGLEKTATVIVILPEGIDEETGQRTGRARYLQHELRNLLNNFRAQNAKIQVEFVSPDEQPVAVAELARKYHFTERTGVLVLYGDAEKSPASQFVKESEILGADPGNPREVKFKGEQALVSALNFLQDEKAKPVVYVLQGNEELDLYDNGPQSLNGLGELRSRLQEENYEVKGLQLTRLKAQPKNPQTVVAGEVPKDAGTVIVPGSKGLVSADAVAALRAYMSPADPAQKKGTMIVLLDPVIDAQKNLVQTGLEPLLGEFGILLPNELVLGLPTILTRNPQDVVAAVNSRSKNPIVSAFRRSNFILHNARTVRPRDANVPTSAHVVEPLLYTGAAAGAWVETDLKTDPSVLAQDLSRRDNEEGRDKKLKEALIPVAVTVGEAGQVNPNDPHAGFRPPEQKPRLVVFGTSSLASNRGLRNPGNYGLVSGAVAWLREKPSAIGEVTAKERRLFTPNWTADGVTRLYVLPGALLLLGVVGLGAGVWVVRRR